MSRLPLHVQGLFLATIGALFLTPDGLFVRLAHAHEWAIVFWRGLVIGTLLLSFQIIRSRTITGLIPKTRWEGLAIVFSMLGTITFVMSIIFTSVANALVILSTMSLFAALFSLFFLKERIALHTLIAMTAAIFGIIVVFFDGLKGEGMVGMLIALACSFVTAANMTLFRGQKTINIPVVFAWGGLSAAAVSAFFADTLTIGLSDGVVLFSMGTASALAFVFIGSGAKRIPAPEVALLMLLETILGPVWVWAILDEIPSLYALIGGTIVILTLAAHAFVSLKKRA